MEKILRIEKIENRFKNHISMYNNVYIEQISKIEQKINSITLISTVIIYTILILSVINNLLFNFFLLIFIILGCDLILLYRAIMYDIIIPDKLIHIYKNGYYVYGYILTESLLWYHIDEIFFEQEEADDFVLSLMNDIFLEKRKCFKCKEEMNYIHYHRNNISKMSTLQLAKIWKSHHVQLFCCKCYNKSKRKKLKLIK